MENPDCSEFDEIHVDMQDFVFTQEDLRNIEQLEQNILQREEPAVYSDSDTENLHFTRKRRRFIIHSDTESEADFNISLVTGNVATDHTSRKWSQPRDQKPSVIPFIEMPGIKSELINSFKDASPGEFYSFLVPDEVFEMIAQQTNLFYTQSVASRNIQSLSRSHAWKPTNKHEIKAFFGLILYMGLVRLPKLSYYWSKDKIMGQTFPSTIMSRNRFEILLQYLHFSDNQTTENADRIDKIRPIIDILNDTFKQYYTPKQDICVDESQVPFRGRIIFRQYNKSKRHKYGLKLFKLCTIPGYTCKLDLYSGINMDTVNTTPTKVVMSLCKEILNKGYTLATDHWYTSLELAYNLLEHQTHSVGTLRKNRSRLPKNVIDAKLQRGDFTAMENEYGITVLKWKDKRDVLIKHSDNIGKIVKKSREISKPKIVLNSNKSKGSVDMRDQMCSYSSPLRKTVKWYRKLGIEILLNTAVVNACVIFTETTNKKISIVEFRKLLVENLTSSLPSQQDESVALVKKPKRLKHELKKKSGKVRNTRRFCVQCYKGMVQEFGRNHAKNRAKKVNTYCAQCDGEPHLCLFCFNKFHRYK